jgi:hypothetical protein
VPRRSSRYCMLAIDSMPANSRRLTSFLSDCFPFSQSHRWSPRPRLTWMCSSRTTLVRARCRSSIPIS